MANPRAAIYHNLSTMLGAGLPILRCLKLCARGPTSGLHRAFAHVAADVEQGFGLAQSMARHPRAFRRLDVMLIEAGETSGNLPDIVKMLSQWYEFCNQLRRNVCSEMALPVIILLLASFIVPFPSLFLEGLGTTGYFIRVSIPLACLFVPIVLILAIVYFTPQTGPLRYIADWIGIRTPIFSRAVRRLALSRYFRIFNMLFKSGVPIVESAQMAAESSGNAVVGSWVRQAPEVAKQGLPMSEGFSRDVPQEFVDAWVVGEETGDLDKVSGKLADITAEQAQDSFHNISVWVPRIIYFIIVIWMIKMMFVNLALIYGRGMGGM